MQLKNIEKKSDGHYITRYNLTYETVDKKEKVYEIISRNPNLTEAKQLNDSPVDSVVLIIHDETNEHILLNREFRLAVNEWVYNFPAGLIDPGEIPMEAAKRELHEETGLILDKIVDIIPESYGAVGFSNEKNICIVGTASGTFSPSTSTVEEIEAGWYNREQIKELLSNHRFAARTQAYCYMWCRQNS